MSAAIFGPLLAGVLFDLIRIGFMLPIGILFIGFSIVAMMAVERGEVGDSQLIVDLIDQMLSTQDENGSFEGLVAMQGSDPTMGSFLCDSHIISEVMIAGGYSKRKQLKLAISKIGADLKETSQGTGWKCEPHTGSRKRGPGRKDDICPQVTIEALRLFSLLPSQFRPAGLTDAARTILSCWSDPKHEKHYLFGHGSRFRRFKPPFFWYDVGTVTDALSRYSEIRREPAFIEMLSAALSNAGPDGKVVPRSAYRLFKDWSFGQKKTWSPWTTMYLCRILKRSEDVLDHLV